MPDINTSQKGNSLNKDCEKDSPREEGWTDECQDGVFKRYKAIQFLGELSGFTGLRGHLPREIYKCNCLCVCFVQNCCFYYKFVI